MKLEKLLNGGYNGLYGEVVTEDCYRLRRLPFEPTLIFDFGANIGVFTRFAGELFPNAKIIAVEPDANNCEVFIEHTNNPNVTLIQKAIGRGMIWRCDGAENGAHESYLSSGLGFPFKEGVLIPKISETKVEAVMPQDIFKQYMKEITHGKWMLKMDIEASENIIWDDGIAMAWLVQTDYLAMEYHQSALTGGALHDEVRERTYKAFCSFKDTHRCQLVHPMFYALKKQYTWK